MPQNATETPEGYTTPLTLPADGDAVDGTGFKSFVDQIAKRFTFLRSRSYAGEAADQLQQPLFVSAGAAFSADWGTLETVAAPLGIYQADVVGHFPLYVPVTNLPKNGKIVGIGMYVDPAGSHGALPAQQPRLRLYRVDPGSSSAATLIATAQDAQGSVGTYEVAHAVTEGSLTEVVAHDGGNVYFFEITGEDSTNALSGMKVTSAYILVDPS
jgi:hypothetical protein